MNDPNLPPLARRYLERVRRATQSSDQLRAADGDIIARVLDLLDQGDIREATRQISPLMDASPLRDLAHFLMALVFEADNDRELALAALAAIMGEEQSSYDVLCLTGDLYGDWHRPADGIKAYDRAIALAPLASPAFLRRGRLRSTAGDVTAAIADLERATLLRPDLAEAHLALADEYRDASMTEAAIAAYRKALAIAPDNPDIAVALDTVIASVIPPWHAAMLNDTRRNEAYDAAIRRAVEPGSLVLDIGTGAGLLAMMAARAGAEYVIACEAVGVLAETAKEIVALNGLSERITVVHKHARHLQVGTDLPRPADILVTEIFDAGLLEENILETAADARTRLLAPGARIIPEGATTFAVPIECAAIAAERSVSDSAGFDVSPFNSLTPQQYLQCDLTRYDWRPLAQPVELFHFDFTRDTADNGETTLSVTPHADGTARGIALWFSLTLDSGTAIATGPMHPPTHWRQAVYAVNPPVAVKQNEPVRLRARHNRRKILVDLRA